MISLFPLKFSRGVGLLGVVDSCRFCFGFFFLFFIFYFGFFIGGFFFPGYLFWVFGWATYVFSEALRVLLVYLKAHCTFLIYTTLLIKKKKKNLITNEHKNIRGKYIYIRGNLHTNFFPIF